MTYALTGLEGKVAVVTGAGRMLSIGRSIAVELARAGCDVALTGSGRSPDTFPDEEKEAGWRDVESVADQIRELGRRAFTMQCDVSDDEAVDLLGKAVLSELGRVDIVVNTAAAAYGGDRNVPLVDITPDLFRYVLEVNTVGPYLMSRTFGRYMLDAGNGGSIVNISSIASKYFPPNSAAYAASKAALNALTAVMAQEVGGEGIRVNAICVGPVETSRVQHVIRSKGFEEYKKQLALGRIGAGEDIAHTVVFLCSDQASWVTGQLWNVDGGRVVGR